MDTLLKHAAALELVGNRVPDVAREARLAQAHHHTRARMLQALVPRDIAAIHQFYRELNQLLTSHADGPKKLKETDFPASVRRYRAGMQAVQHQIQRKMVEATSAGGTSTPDFGPALQEMIIALKAYWGSIGPSAVARQPAKL